MLRFLLVVVVLGLIWWLLGFLGLPDPFLTIARVVIIVALIWELVATLGYAPSALEYRRRP